jgi:hypothetical protein
MPLCARLVAIYPPHLTPSTASPASGLTAAFGADATSDGPSAASGQRLEMAELGSSAPRRVWSNFAPYRTSVNDPEPPLRRALFQWALRRSIGHSQFGSARQITRHCGRPSKASGRQQPVTPAVPFQMLCKAYRCRLSRRSERCLLSPASIVRRTGMLGDSKTIVRIVQFLALGTGRSRRDQRFARESRGILLAQWRATGGSAPWNRHFTRKSAITQLDTAQGAHAHQIAMLSPAFARSLNRVTQ